MLRYSKRRSGRSPQRGTPMLPQIEKYFADIKTAEDAAHEPDDED